jgi:DNA-binding GntR family transcriptional regulator
MQRAVRDPARRHSTDHTLAETVFEQLKREIVENRLEADTLLTELDVAARFSVSRAPAREALKRLAALGFVRPRARVGYLVTNVSVADLDEIFAMRIQLEPMATQLAVGKMTDADAAILERLAAGVLHIDEAVDDRDRGLRVSRLNADFHREIARISGNRHLEQVVMRLVDELERVMHMLAYSEGVGSVLDEHSQLLAVMRSGDAEGAGDLMRDQLQHDYSIMRSLVVNTSPSITLRRAAQRR